MNNNKKFFLSVICGLIVSAFLSFASCAPASAAVTSNEILKHALSLGISSCYQSSVLNTPVTASKAPLTAFNDLTQTPVIKNYTSVSIVIPTLVGNTDADSKVTCAEAIAGGSGVQGLLSLYGKPSFNAASNTSTNLVSLGYTQAANKAGETLATGNRTIIFPFTQETIVKNTGQGDASSGSLEVVIGTNGEVVSSSAPVCDTSNLSASSTGFCIMVADMELNQSGIVESGRVVLHPSTKYGQYNVTAGFGAKFKSDGSVEWYTLGLTDCNMKSLKVDGVMYACSTAGDGSGIKYSNFGTPTQEFQSDPSQVDDAGSYEITNFSTALSHFRSYLGATDQGFTPEELKVLYYDNYFVRVWNDNLGGSASVSSDCKSSPSGAGSDEYYVPNNGQWCKIDSIGSLTVKNGSTASNEGKFAIANSANNGLRLTSSGNAGIKEVVKALMAIGDQLDISEGTNLTTLVSGSDTPGEDDAAAGDSSGNGNRCLGAADSLGWVLCPVIAGIGAATTGIYDLMIEPFLNINAGLVSDDAAVDAWNVFRNFANVLFAIAFIVVILSQLTGIGLSNYNIKKILPRLIMVVVLVNISLVVCQLAIDVSNILGYNLREMFIKLANDSNSQVTFSGIASGFLVDLGLVTAGIAAGTHLSLVTTVLGELWDIWLIPFLLMLLAAIVAIIFFFITLSIRQAGVIILTVLSPVAVVCYALPNTKKVFDKWLHLFGALLLVYPICGALMGGGNFMSSIMVRVGNSKVGADGFIYDFVAMMLSVVPFFFIPSILRSSMNGIAQLGNRIGNLGGRMGRGLRGAVGNSEAVKDLQDARKERRDQSVYKRLRSRRKRTPMQERRMRALKHRLDERFKESEAARIDAENNPRLLSEDPDAAQRFRDSYNSSARNRDADDMLTAMAGGGVASLSGNGNVNLNDMQPFGETDSNGNPIAAGAVAQEYADTMNRLQADPENRELRTRQAALTKHLMSTPKGMQIARQVMQQQLAAGNTDAVRQAADSIVRGGYLNAIKKDGGRGFYGMVQDIANGQFDRATGGHGLPTMDDILAHYGMMGAGSYKADELLGEDESVLDDINSAMAAGYGSAADRRTYARLANQILSTPELLSRTPEKVRSRLRRMASLGYGTGAASYTTTHGTNTALPQGQHSAGSLALSEASSDMVSALNTHISDIASSGPVTQGSAEYQELQNLGENIRRTLEGPDALDGSVVSGLQQALATIKTTGVTDLDGNSFNPVSPTAIKVRGADNSAAGRTRATVEQYLQGQIQTVQGTHLNARSSISDLSREFGDVLTTLSQPTADVAQFQPRLDAVQSMMVNQGSQGVEGLMQEYARVLSDPNLTNEAKTSLQISAQQLLNSGASQQISASNPTMYELLNTVASGNIGNYSSQNDVINQFSTAIPNITAARIQELTPDSMARLGHTIATQNLPSSDVVATARAASNAIQRNDLSQSQLSGAQQLVANCLASGDGTTVAINMSPSSLTDVAEWIRHANQGKQFTAADASSPEYQLIQQLTENVRTAAQQSTASSTTKSALKKLMAATKAMGVLDSNQHIFN